MNVPQATRPAAVPTGPARLQEGSAARADRILPEVRWIAGPIIIVLLVAAVILYGLPDQTPALFAWTIQPTMSALIMGAGYGAGAYYFARVFLCSTQNWYRSCD